MLKRTLRLLVSLGFVLMLAVRLSNPLVVAVGTCCQTNPTGAMAVEQAWPGSPDHLADNEGGSGGGNGPG
jgi:hypothetical protein